VIKPSSLVKPISHTYLRPDLFDFLDLLFETAGQNSSMVHTSVKGPSVLFNFGLKIVSCSWEELHINKQF